MLTNEGKSERLMKTSAEYDSTPPSPFSPSRTYSACLRPWDLEGGGIYSSVAEVPRTSPF